MTPYRSPLLRHLGNPCFLLILVTALGVTPSRASAGPETEDFEALTHSGWEHFYSLQYDLAQQDFERALQARSDDAAAVNHVLDCVLYRELYKNDALDTRLYSRQGFITSKQVPVDSSVKQLVQDLSERALYLSDKRLKSDPTDAQALYNRGVTLGLKSTYMVMVEHSWFGALRSALAARRDHEQVLKLHPDWSDAKTLVGAHNFVVGSLTTPVKAMAGIAGIRGDKKKGLQMLAEAGNAHGETSTDARVALALFLRREGQFEQAREVVHTLMRDHPNNFLFALEEGSLLKEENKNSEAATSLRNLLSSCNEGKYPNAHVEMAWFTLGEALRGEGRLQEALRAYEASANAAATVPNYRQQALLGAGEVSDMLAKRQDALLEYRAAIALDGASEEAQTARKYLDHPYSGK